MSSDILIYWRDKMKKIIALILAFSNAAVCCASGLDISISGRRVTVSGTGQKSGIHSVSITDSEENMLYAIEEFRPDENGNINEEIILPQNFTAGKYKLLHGGVASRDYTFSERTYEFDVIREDCDIEYISGSFSGRRAKGGTLNVSAVVRNRVSATEDTEFKISLLHRGESVICEKSVVLAEDLSANKNCDINVSLVIPYLAPDSDDYSLVIEAENVIFSNGENRALISGITIGNPVDPVIQPEIIFTDVSVDGRSIKISSVTESALELYVKFIKDGALYAVSECDYSENATVTIPNLPAGDYTVVAGAYGARGESEAVLYTSENETDCKPLSNGTYIAPDSGNEYFWYVNENGTLIREGKPYVPMGAMVCLDTLTNYSLTSEGLNQSRWASDKKLLQEIYDKGVRDIYINTVNCLAPAWVLTEICNYMDKLGLNYGIQFNAGDDYETDSYEIRAYTGKLVDKNATLTAEYDCSALEGSIAGGFYTLVKDGEVSRSGECEVNGSVLSCELPDGVYDVYFTPKIRTSGAVYGNYWDNYSQSLEKRRNFANQLGGENLMCVIDPYRNESGFYNQYENHRPSGEEYNKRFERWLCGKYGSENELRSVWGNESLDFKTASQIIPLFTDKDTLSVFCINTKNGETYELDGKEGVMWQDFLTFRDYSFAEFNNDLADAIKEKADVPVIIKNVWGHKEYFINSRTTGGIDGLGSESYGNYDRIRHLQASNYNMTKRFAKTAWNIVTETNTEEDINKKYESGKYGYGTEEYMHGHFDTLFESGAKGVYDFVISAPHHQPTHVAYSYMENPSQFEWLENYRNKLDAEKVAADKYRKTTVGLMSFNSNHYTTPNRWTAVLPAQYPALHQSYEDSDFSVFYGDAVFDCDIMAAVFEDKPASIIWGKRFAEALSDDTRKMLLLGFRYDIGTIPETDIYFTNEFSENEKGVKVQILRPSDSSVVLATTPDGKPYALRDGNLYIVSASDAVTTGKLKYISELGIADDENGFYAQNVLLTENTDKSYTVSAEIVNTLSEERKGKIIIAGYEESGRMSSVVTREFTIKQSQNVVDVEYTPSQNDKYIKCFVFGSEITPIAEAVVKEVSN